MLARFSDVLAEGFRIVTPDGRTVERAPLLAGLRAAHASRTEPTMRIWVDNIEARPAGGGLWIVGYQEWQQREGEAARGRQSTAVMRARPKSARTGSARTGSGGTGVPAPNGIEWLHVHETWLSD